MSQIKILSSSFEKTTNPSTGRKVKKFLKRKSGFILNPRAIGKSVEEFANNHKHINFSLKYDTPKKSKASVLADARKLIAHVKKADNNKMGRFQMSYDNTQTGSGNLSTKFILNKKDAIKQLEVLINQVLAQYGEVDIDSIEYSYLDIPQNVDLLVQGNKNYIQVGLPNEGEAVELENNHIVYNPSAKTNCFFQSIAVDLNPDLIGQDKIVHHDRKKYNPIAEKAKSIKRYSRCQDCFAGEEDIKKVSQYIKRDILVLDKKLNYKHFYSYQRPLKQTSYSKDGKLVIKISPAKKPCVVIFDNNHSYAYFEKPNNFIVKAKIPNKSKTMKEGKLENTRDTNYCTADLESFLDDNKASKPFSIAYADYKDDQVDYKPFLGHHDCLEKFFESIFDFKGTKRTCFFHNGGKFDIPVIIQNFLKDNTTYTIDNKNKVFLNGRYAKFVVYSGKKKIVFLDSICFFNLSLDAITGEKGLNVEHKKLSGEINHDLVNIANYRDIYFNGQDGGVPMEKYLYNDVVGLLECIDKFSIAIFEKFQINITNVISASSISKRVFKSKYLKPDKPIHMLDDTDEKFIRLTYHGGRTECFYKGVCMDKLYYYDFTSLYPSVASVGNCGLPYGKPMNLALKGECPLIKDRIISKDNKKEMDFLETYASFIECQVRTLDFKAIPIHCTNKDGKLIFPHFENWTTLQLTSEEILMGIKKGVYEYKPIKAVFFKKDKILQDYFKDLFDQKCQAKKEGLDAMCLVYKIIANSGYGFWAIKTKDRQDLDIIDQSQMNVFYDHLINGQLTDVYKFGERIVCRYKKDIDDIERNVAIGSYITSLARLKIWDLMNDITNKGFKVYYCDTDSVITNCRLDDHKDLMDKYCWDGTGEDLGSLKNEITDKIAKVCKKKKVKSDGSCDYIDRSYFAGLKTYRWSTTFTDTNGEKHYIDDSKLKGFKQEGDTFNNTIRKLKDFDYKNMLNGDNITQTVNQFSSNKRSSGQQFQTIKKVPKKFKYSYNKGLIEDNGNIKPYII